jgi:hypothetical protein
MRFHLRLLLLGVFAALTVMAVGVITAGAETPATAQPAATPQPAPAADKATALQPGMRAFIEPETGKLGQPAVVPALTPEEEAAKPANEPVLVHMPDGSDMLELNGAIQDYMVIKLDANGNKVVNCVEDPKAALQTPPPAPQREDR